MTIPILAIVLFLTHVNAFPHAAPARPPWYARQNGPSSPPSQGSTDGGFSGVSTQIWIPVVVIALLGFVLVITLCRKRTGVISPESVRQATADQLAGAVDGSAPDRPRRSRRPRRTPSQISTTSLPAYMKEPGDQELVIYRALPDMEDASLFPPPGVLPSVDERDSLHSRNNSDTSPLLQSEFHDQQNIRSLRRSRRRPANASLTSNSPEIVDGSSSIDPRDEVPPYVEVDDTSAARYATLSVQDPNSYPPPPIPPPSAMDNGAVNLNQEPTRFSGFRSLFNAFSHPGSLLPTHLNGRTPANGHARSVSSDTSNTVDSSTPLRPTHQRSSSGSISSLNVPPFGPVSRQQSNNTMNSSSQISLNSISSPLTHTLVRTEFTYPKAGLTPEQLKLISSRESLGKFGIPYGPDAVAFASNSRQDLPPPPDFDAPSTSGPSRLGQEVYTAPSPSPPPPVASLPANRSPLNRVVSRPSYRLPRGIPTAHDEKKASGSESGNQDTSIPSSSVNGYVTAMILPPPSPPSAFRFPSTPLTDAVAVDRSVSRASSFVSTATYATAQESLRPISGVESVSASSTVRDEDSQIRHPPEGTETSVAPGRGSDAGMPLP